MDKQCSDYRVLVASCWGGGAGAAGQNIGGDTDFQVDSMKKLNKNMKKMEPQCGVGQ